MGLSVEARIVRFLSSPQERRWPSVSRFERSPTRRAVPAARVRHRRPDGHPAWSEERELRDSNPRGLAPNPLSKSALAHSQPSPTVHPRVNRRRSVAGERRPTTQLRRESAPIMKVPTVIRPACHGTGSGGRRLYRTCMTRFHASSQVIEPGSVWLAPCRIAPRHWYTSPTSLTGHLPSLRASKEECAAPPRCCPSPRSK